ncbi:Arginase, catabolizes arginine to ornithine and urea [Ascosphaera acerosa]|nr:Arginase, catabolizes arginine to ornithine and urea [Ascosphaera acerosa]
MAINSNSLGSAAGNEPGRSGSHGTGNGTGNGNGSASDSDSGVASTAGNITGNETAKAAIAPAPYGKNASVGSIGGNGCSMSSARRGYHGRYTTSTDELGLSIASFAGGQRKPGVALGPQAMLQSGLHDILVEERGFTLHRRDALPTALSRQQKQQQLPLEATESRKNGMLNPHEVSAFCKSLSEQTYQLAKDGRLVLTLGGDHSIAMGSISGMQRAIRERFPRGVVHHEHEAAQARTSPSVRLPGKSADPTCPAQSQELGIIWVDAHPDINTPEISDSGNVHGMPVAFLAGLARAANSGDPFSWLQPELHGINLRKLVYIGIRDADVGEKKIIRENGILTFTMHDVEEYVLPNSP